ncbi:hypothetical protein [Priestia aryabhattai]|uniref:hypothetical protein n=1 Tax=Priestia aryabhattai TaxID=412384 RepID=UPI001594C760
MGEYYKKVVGGRHYKGEESKKFYNDCTCDHHYYYEKDEKDEKKECDCCCVPGLVEKLQKLNGRFVKIYTTGGNYFWGQLGFCGDECDTVELAPYIPGLFSVTISICEITTIIDLSGLSTTELTTLLNTIQLNPDLPDPGNSNPLPPGGTAAPF